MPPATRPCIGRYWQNFLFWDPPQSWTGATFEVVMVRCQNILPSCAGYLAHLSQNPNPKSSCKRDLHAQLWSRRIRYMLCAAKLCLHRCVQGDPLLWWGWFNVPWSTWFGLQQTISLEIGWRASSLICKSCWSWWAATQARRSHGWLVAPWEPSSIGRSNSAKLSSVVPTSTKHHKNSKQIDAAMRVKQWNLHADLPALPWGSMSLMMLDSLFSWQCFSNLHLIIFNICNANQYEVFKQFMQTTMLDDHKEKILDMGSFEVDRQLWLCIAVWNLYSLSAEGLKYWITAIYDLSFCRLNLYLFSRMIPSTRVKNWEFSNGIHGNGKTLSYFLHCSRHEVSFVGVQVG